VGLRSDAEVLKIESDMSWILVLSVCIDWSSSRELCMDAVLLMYAWVTLAGVGGGMCLWMGKGLGPGLGLHAEVDKPRVGD